jgi:DNA mismatch repair protein MutL
MEEMKKVIYDLQSCRQPYHCPHGRPTVITFSDKDLIKEFERG